ncbi:DUF4280 domain-containing protein [Oceanivirga miroungae]|uniref:DUF4280 domain-containing protein n=1 Tax=Oceanivirga miroungae TaxID=1130046 RepID=A0A6I8M7D4_9FUSO|nr:DUF4280 domain-containing protein [Oceanivirga miroungae]VWL85326.1 hypothetical protein OMES3154_00610 [Oceanivirga miroungae]
MELKYFENEKIPDEIEKFYDDLANIYLKKEYDSGAKENGELDKENIGRYMLSELDISLVDKNIDVDFLVYSTDGYKKQDEIILNYDKYILLKELKNIIENYLNEVIDLSNFKNMDEKYKATMKVTLPGLLIATHKFNIRKLTKLFKEKTIYLDENNIPITWYIDDKDYDLSFLVEDLYELVFPNYDDENDDIEIDENKEFVGNKTNDIVKELEKTEKKDSKLLKFLQGIGKKALDVGGEIAKTYIIERIKKEFSSDENKDERKEDKKEERKEKEKENKNIEEKKQVKKEEIKKKNNKNKSYRVDKNKKNLEKINKKFSKDYGLDNLVKYFLDVTNRIANKKEKKVLNEVLKAENENNNEVVNQDKTKEYKSIEKKPITTVEYIYNIASNSNNPLESIEKSLKYLSAKYEKSNVSNISDITKETIKRGVKALYIDTIKKLTDDDLKNNKDKLVLDLGLVDVDEIPININSSNLLDIKKTYEYKLVKLIKDMNLVDKSFSKKAFVRKYVKTRRLLDNIQIKIVKALCKLENENFDNVVDNDKNIFCKYIIYLDQTVKGLSDYEYTMFSKLEKKVNITSLVIYLVKSKYSFKDESIIYISNELKGLKYSKYVKSDSKNIDSVKIKKIFPNFGSLEENFNLRKSPNISSFYEELYDNKKDLKKYFVCDGATLSCKFSNSTTSLICKNTSKYIEGKNIATIENKDIIPFSNCSINPDGICKPQLKNWEKKSDELVDNIPVLISDSFSFCSLGGVINIVDANQKKSGISEFDKKTLEKKYYINDYAVIDADFVLEFCDLFFNLEDRNIYNNIRSINALENSVLNYLRLKFKAKKDELNLENENTIAAVNQYEKKIINIYDLKKYTKGYYLGLIKYENKENDKIIKESMRLSKLIPIIFLKKVFDRLDVIYMPYDSIDIKNEKKASWMKAVLKSLNNNKLSNKKNFNLFFVLSTINNGLYTDDINIFLSDKIDKYYEKIDEVIYGSVILFKNDSNTYYIAFLISKTKEGYYVIGGDNNGKVKKSFHKSAMLVNMFWPK